MGIVVIGPYISPLSHGPEPVVIDHRAHHLPAASRPQPIDLSLFLQFQLLSLMQLPQLLEGNYEVDGEACVLLGVVLGDEVDEDFDLIVVFEMFFTEMETVDGC
jgi:hypothetical protein